MNKIFFFLFVSFFFLLFYALNRYVVARMGLALSGIPYLKNLKIIYWIFAFTFFIGQFLERLQPHFITKIVSGIGSIWLAWFMYIILAIVFIDLFRLLNHWFSIIPSGIFTGKMLALFVFVFSMGIVTYGFFNAQNPIVKTVVVNLEKPLQRDLKIALVSDLHIGAINGNKKIEKMMHLVNQQKPDILLIAGDLVDHNPQFAIKNQVGLLFQKIHAPLGIYAVTGNHEYIGDAETSVAYFSKNNVKYLRDSLINIEDIIQIAGREDKQKWVATGQKRKELSSILANSNPKIPIILIDHQPVEYDNVIAQNVDLMVSGHTHKGQMWPMNYITKVVFENDYGLYQRSKTWFYTSNGFGTWGPPVRVGNRPEVVFINLKNRQ